MSRVWAQTSLEWLDAIPSDWSEREIGREVWVRARLGWKGLTADEYVDEGIPMLATPDIKGPEIAYQAANKITAERYDESPEIGLRRPSCNACSTHGPAALAIALARMSKRRDDGRCSHCTSQPSGELAADTKRVRV